MAAGGADISHPATHATRPPGVVGAGRANHDRSHAFGRDGDLPLWTISYLARGRARFDSRGQAFEAEPRSVTLIAPHTPYRVSYAAPRGQWTEYWAFVDACDPWLPPPEHWPEVIPGLFNV